MSSTQDDLKTEFAYLRDTVIDAIRAQRVTAVRDGLDTYERLLTTFVNALAALGVPYSREAALAEVNSIGGGGLRSTGFATTIALSRTLR